MKENPFTMFRKHTLFGMSIDISLHILIEYNSLSRSSRIYPSIKDIKPFTFKGPIVQLNYLLNSANVIKLSSWVCIPLNLHDLFDQMKQTLNNNMFIFHDPNSPF